MATVGSGMGDYQPDIDAPMPRDVGGYWDTVMRWIGGNGLESNVLIRSLGSNVQEVRDQLTRQLGDIMARLEGLGDLVPALTTKIDSLANLIADQFNNRGSAPSAVPPRVKVWYRSSVVIITGAFLVGALTTNLLYKIGAGVTAEAAYQLGLSSEGYFNQKQIAIAPQDTVTEKTLIAYQAAQSSLSTDADYQQLRQKQRQFHQDN